MSGIENNNIDNSINKTVKLSVTRLLSYLPHDVVRTALSYIDVKEIKNIADRTTTSICGFESDDEYDSRYNHGLSDQ